MNFSLLTTPSSQRASSVQSLIIHGCVNGTPRAREEDVMARERNTVVLSAKCRKIGQTVALKRGIENREVKWISLMKPPFQSPSGKDL